MSTARTSALPLVALALLVSAATALAGGEGKKAPPPPPPKPAPARVQAPPPGAATRPGNLGRLLQGFGRVPPPPPRFDPRMRVVPRPVPGALRPNSRFPGRVMPVGPGPGRALQYRPYVLRTVHRAPVMLSQRVARCSNPMTPGCQVWGRLRGPQDTNIIAGMARFAARSGGAHRAWIGPDGQRREVWITYTPPVRVNYAVAFIPAGALVLAADEQADTQYAYTQVPDDTTQPAAPEPETSAPLTPSPVEPTSIEPTSVEPAAAATGAPVAVVQNPICRTKQETALVAASRDQASELECRDANGDWSPAVPASELMAAGGPAEQ